MRLSRLSFVQAEVDSKQIKSSIFNAKKPVALDAEKREEYLKEWFMVYKFDIMNTADRDRSL